MSQDAIRNASQIPPAQAVSRSITRATRRKGSSSPGSALRAYVTKAASLRMAYWRTIKRRVCQRTAS